MRGNQTPKYLKLKQEILGWMLSGKLKPDQMIPSENELAALFNISRHTVRQAIGDMVKDDWLYRIQGKGTFVKSPDMKIENSSRTIGVITTYLSDYIFPHIIRGIESTLRNKGYRLLLSSTDNDKKKERESLETMMEYPLSGLIIEPTKSALENQNLHYYLQLQYNKTPFIMINERYPELDCPCIKGDDEMGGFLAAEHLIERGHRNIAGFFKTDDLQGLNRMQGFIHAHNKHNVPISSAGITQYTTETSLTKPVEAAFDYLQLTDRPTAFVCYNDQLAIRILEIIRQKGLRIPDDLSVVGFDDSALAVASEVKLTSVSHPKAKLGTQAAESLIAEIEHKKANSQQDLVVITPELVIRESTASI
jgi:GntR family transcriptional regulator of arabinose operon